MKRVTHFLCFTCALCLLNFNLAAQANYTITTTPTSIVITDNDNNGESLDAIENGTNINFLVSGRTYSLNAGPATNFPDPAGLDIDLTGITSITINAQGGDDVVSLGAFTAAFPSLTVNGGTENDVIVFAGDLTFATDANCNVDLQNDDPTPGTDRIELAGGSLLLSGTGSVDWKASQNIVFAGGTTLQTANGNLTLEANQQVTPTSGDFIGIDASAAGVLVECTGTGVLNIKGKGGNSGADNVGVQAGTPSVGGSTLKGGTAGTFTVVGAGGASSTGDNNRGVVVGGSGAFITSNGANVSVTGLGGGSGGSGANHGVRVVGTGGTATITAEGSGTVTVHGSGGTASTGNGNIGVVVFDNATITSSGGDVHVTGIGGGMSGSVGNAPQGINMSQVATITAGGSGDVTVVGTAGNTTGTNVQGITLGAAGGSSIITSNGGDVHVTGTGSVGTGSTLGAGRECRGIQIQSANGFNATISAGGNGTVTVIGNGGGSGTAPGSQFHSGVYINNFNSTGNVFITSNNGNVSVTGVGGGAGTTTQGNVGIEVRGANAAAHGQVSISAGGALSTVTVNGTGGTTTTGNNNTGISLAGKTLITSSGGSVSVTGQGGGTGASTGNEGVFLNLFGTEIPTITAGGSGTVTVSGTGGGDASSGGGNNGVNLNGPGATITSGGGSVSITGNGGGNGSASNSNYGVTNNGGTITAGSTGTVTVNGTGGSTSGNNNHGVVVNGTGTFITSSGGNINVTGTAGGTGSSAFNYGIYVQSGAEITATGSGTLTAEGTGATSNGNSNYGVYITGSGSLMASTGGNVSVTGEGGGSGGASSGHGIFVELAGSIFSDGALSLDATGSPGTGNDNHGLYVNNSTITCTGGNTLISASAGNGTDSKDILLENGGELTSIGGNNIYVNAVNSGFWPHNTGTDITTDGALVLDYLPGGDLSLLNIDIDGQFNYHILTVDGDVDLSNAMLDFAGSGYAPVIGHTFTIVDNIGLNPITGTFNGLAEGATIQPFLSPTRGATITYVGGDGNDVVITVVPIVVPPPVWTGAINDDWTLPGNWNPSNVPTGSDNVIIPNVSSGSNTYPVLSGNVTAEVQDLTINAGAKITMTVVAGDMPNLVISGDLTNNGAANVGTGFILFAKPGTVTFNGALTTNGIIVIGFDGNNAIPSTHLDNNGNLTIASGGQLLHGEQTILGDLGTISNDPITVQRSGNPGIKIWNFWGSPVTGANTNVVGQRPHYYDPMSALSATAIDSMQLGWKPATGLMAQGVGYIGQNSPATTSFKGTVDDWNTGQVVMVNLRKGIVPYNLLGNPFPTAMDATEFMNANTVGGFFPNLTGDIWFWDDDGSDGSGYATADFSAWNGTGNVFGPNSGKPFTGSIATGQGFFVETLFDNVPVGFHNSFRNPLGDNQFQRQAPKSRLWVNVTNTYGLYNEVLIGFLPNATDGYDMGFDAKKMKGNENIALYTKIGTGDYMIQALPELTGDRVVELGLDAGLTGTHTLSLKEIEAMDETVIVWLEDKLTGTWQNLRLNPSYDFEVTVPGSMQQRFYLHFTPALEIASTEASCDGSDAVITLNQPGSQHWNYILTDAAGNVMHNSQSAFNGTEVLAGLEKGNYNLLLSDGSGYQLVKGISVNGKEKVTAGFMPSATEIFAGQQVQFTNQSDGATAYEWSFGDGNTITGIEDPAHQYAAEGTYTVMLRASNADCFEEYYSTVNVLKLSTGINGTAADMLRVYSFEKRIFVKLDFGREEQAQLIVLDLLGKEVYSRMITTKGNFEVDMSGNPDNPYFVFIRTGTKTYPAKVILTGN